MYVDRIEIRHLKLLEDFKLSFRNADGSPRMWTVIIGENGTAKTSILQAIALAAAGSPYAYRLAETALGHLRDRRGDAPMEIVLDLRLDQPQQYSVRANRVRSSLTLRKHSNVLVGGSAFIDANDNPVSVPPISTDAPNTTDDPLVDARAESRPGWFVAGYGVSRFLPNPAMAPSLTHPPIERLRPLFEQTISLTSLRFAEFFGGERAREFSKILRDTLTLTTELIPGLEDITLTGQGGVTRAGDLIERDRIKMKSGRDVIKLPGIALSHGYQSTIAWIADLVGHMMLESEHISPPEMSGVVMIDEIDAYLHPRWQAGLVEALRKTFPKIQFIATTHSPVVLSGLAPDEIVRVAQHPETGSVARWSHDARTGELVPVTDETMATIEPDPRMMTGTEIYRDWFAVDRLLLNPAGQDLREWYRIATNPYRDDIDDAKLTELRARLRSDGIEVPLEPVPRREPPP